MLDAAENSSQMKTERGPLVLGQEVTGDCAEDLQESVLWKAK